MWETVSRTNWIVLQYLCSGLLIIIVFVILQLIILSINMKRENLLLLSIYVGTQMTAKKQYCVGVGVEV